MAGETALQITLQNKLRIHAKKKKKKGNSYKERNKNIYKLLLHLQSFLFFYFLFFSVILYQIDLRMNLKKQTNS